MEIARTNNVERQERAAPQVTAPSFLLEEHIYVQSLPTPKFVEIRCRFLVVGLFLWKMARYGFKSLKTLVFNVLFAISDKVFDSLLIYNYYKNGDLWWMSLTILAIALPGILEVFYSICTCWRQYRFKDFLIWFIFFGPVLFPVSSIVLHLYMSCRGDYYVRKHYPMTMVLGSLQAFSESMFQFTLQMYILMTKWTSISEFYLQVICSFSSLLILAKTSVEHHYFEVNAKQRMCSFRRSIDAMFIYIFHIFFRVFIIAILTAYLHFYAFIPLVVFLILNFCLTYILKTDLGKKTWTTFSSLATPVCFVSKDDVVRMGYESKKFHHFYKLNTCLFTIVSILSLIAVNIGLKYDKLPFSCESMPFLSCHQDPNCYKACGLTVSSSRTDRHFDFHLYGSIMVVGMSFLHVTTVWLQNNLVKALGQNNHSFMDPLWSTFCDIRLLSTIGMDRVTDRFRRNIDLT